jgi:hypothetical protein
MWTSQAVALVAAAALGACGSSASGGSDAGEGDACVPVAVALTVATPSAYTCGGFQATFSLQNGSCADVTVQDLSVTGHYASGPCSDAAPATGITPSVKVVPAGKTLAIHLFTAGAFCCGSPGCTSTFACGAETFTFTAHTSAGTLTTAHDATITLGPCNPVCGRITLP